MGILNIDGSISHGKTKKRGYIIVALVALACCCAIGLRKFASEENNGRGVMQMTRPWEEEMHRKLDVDFEEAKQQLTEEGVGLLSWKELSSDSTVTVRGIGGEAGVISPSSCSLLGITSDLVTKSRIVGNTNRWNKVIRWRKCQEWYSWWVCPGGCQCVQGKLKETIKKTPDCAWPHHLESMMNEYFTPGDANKPKLEVVNLAQPGTPSSSGITLVMDMIDYDAIIIQWTTNDDSVEKFFGGDEGQVKSKFESLIRSALNLPHDPAVIIFESLGKAMLFPNIVPVAELDHYAIASVYEIPVVSARAAFWREKTFERDDYSWYRKSAHPKDVWHQRLACLMYENWVHESEHPLDMSLWRDPLDQVPMYGGKTMGRCTKQYAASSFEGSLEQAPSISDGWSYYADAPEKFGYISNTTDALLQFDIPHDSGLGNHLLYVKFLRSWTPEWGKAEVWTGPEEIEGRKPAAMIDSHCTEASQIDFIKLNLDSSSDESHKVRIKNIEGKVKIVEVLLYSCTE